MLTKQERAEIAERFRNYDKAEYVTLYSGMYDGLLGEHVPKETTVKKDRMELASRIVDLCDTSNMIELPLDKDGEVIHIHDVVYDNTGMEWEVREFRLPFNGSCIYAHTDDDYATFRPDELTHKATTTITENIEAFNKAVKVTAQFVEASMNECVEAMKKLAEVFNRVGGSDD